MTERSVLVVDDDAAVRGALARLLRRADWTTVEAADGAEGVDRYRDRPTDVVLSDLMMPRLDGVDLLRAVRALDADVPVVLLSGYGTAERCRAVLRAGANDFLPKPCPSFALRRALDRALEARAEACAVADAAGGAGRFEACVPAALAARAEVVARSAGAARSAGLAGRRWPVRLAVREAFTNAVVHGARSDAAASIVVRASFDRPGGTVTVTDPGRGFDAGAVSADPPEAGAGRGLFLIRSFADETRWTDGGRTCGMTWRANVP